MADAGGPDLLLPMPVYDDWDACGIVLADLAGVLHAAGRPATVLIVDDASHEPAPADLGAALGPGIRAIRVLRVARNLGHQRAICVGLCYAAENLAPGTVVVMDADGEDAPADVPRLLQRAAEQPRDAIVFAERTKRSESAWFRVGYQAFRVLHLALTGQGIRQGNFSVVPGSLLRPLCHVAELWSHYAAAICVSRLPYGHVPTQRARRAYGTSSMSFVSLVRHGLSAITVFSETMGIRLVVAGVCGLGAALAAAIVVLVAAVALGSAVSVPMLVAAGGLGLASAAVAAMGAMIALLVLTDRKAAVFVPIRECASFVASVEPVRVGTAAS